MKLELVYNILDILGTMQDVVKQMQQEYAGENFQKFELLSNDLRDGLTVVRQIAGEEIPAESRDRLADACTCALESLKDIKWLKLVRPEKVEWKLEYELGAIIEEMSRKLYYWEIAREHPEERENFRKYIAETRAFQILKIPEESRTYLCDLVILVVAYNKLEYTVECVRDIMNNLPQGINCELILFNHGSSDETREYFENMEGIKVINIAVNSAVWGTLFRVVSRGKYYLQVSNDVHVGKNSIENLVRCIAEHPDYGYVVPSTSAVSNFQTISANYKNREEFQKFAAENNVYDERRHEQRVRLVNPIDMYRSAVFLEMELDLYENKSGGGNLLAFPDDKISCWMRRHGYKNILAKDAYCHHIGSVTINTEISAQEERDKIYLAGRKEFMAYYGIDPWGPGSYFEPNLFKSWKIKPVDDTCILGINCGLGSGSLKVKEVMREQGAKNVRLINCEQDQRYLQDLRGISDEVYKFACLPDIVESTGRNWFEYIVVEENIEGYRQEQIVQEILKAGIQFGEMAYKAGEEWRIYIHKAIM